MLIKSKLKRTKAFSLFIFSGMDIERSVTSVVDTISHDFGIAV